MAIQPRFRLVLWSFLLVFAPGAFTPSAAESELPELSGSVPIEFAATPPPIDDFDRARQPVEPRVQDARSASERAPILQDIEAAPVLDPKTEAFAPPAADDRRPVEAPEGPAYVVEVNPRVEHFVDRFTGSRREVVAEWFRRSGPYLKMIREVLRSHGLPEDLAYTAMIESGFNPVAVSPAGATGLWQFMASTARRYGLRVDRWVDERLDPERSTAAAASYLRDLYAQFGSWLLAQAAYNAGEMAVARAVRRTGSKDFWTIARTALLHRETKDFVPAIQAATLLARNPARYGFVVGDTESPDVERVVVPAETDLKKLGAGAGIPAAALRALNPVLRRGVTPPGTTWEITIPGGTRAGVLEALAPRPTRVASRGAVSRASASSAVHVVRPRDTIAAIAERYGVSIGDVVRWNEIEVPDRIHPGDRLRITEHR